MQKYPYILLGVTLLIADQLSKWAVSEQLVRHALIDAYGAERVGMPMPFFEWLVSAPQKLPFISVEILPFFNMVMVWNKGISFGMLNNGTDYAQYVLSAAAAVISLVFLAWFSRTRSKIQAVTIMMVIAGAMGNVVDRLRFGAVIDFLDFHAYGLHFPAFNVADSCICVGVFLLIIQTFFFDSSRKNAR